MPQALSQYAGLLPMIAILAYLYFFMYKPQKKREKAITEMRNNLQVGDTITTIGGIVGKITVLKEDLIVIETSIAKTKIEMQKWAISSVEK